MQMEYYFLRSIGCSAQEDTLFGQLSLFISMKKSWKNNGKVLLPANFFFMVFLFKVVVFSSNIRTRESSDFGIEVHRKGSKTVSCLFLLTAIISLTDVTLLVFLT